MQVTYHQKVIDRTGVDAANREDRGEIPIHPLSLLELAEQSLQRAKLVKEIIEQGGTAEDESIDRQAICEERETTRSRIKERVIAGLWLFGAAVVPLTVWAGIIWVIAHAWRAL